VDNLTVEVFVFGPTCLLRLTTDVTTLRLSSVTVVTVRKNGYICKQSIHATQEQQVALH